MPFGKGSIDHFVCLCKTNGSSRSPSDPTSIRRRSVGFGSRPCRFRTKKDANEKRKRDRPTIPVLSATPNPTLQFCQGQGNQRPAFIRERRAQNGRKRTLSVGPKSANCSRRSSIRLPCLRTAAGHPSGKRSGVRPIPFDD